MTSHALRRSCSGAVIARALIALCCVPVISIGCRNIGKNNVTDVTADPKYGNFSNVAGTWRTLAPLTLMDMNGSLYLSPTGEHYNSATTDLWKVPVGTQIRITCLIKATTAETELLYPMGSLDSGPYAGRSVQLDDALFLPNVFIPHRLTKLKHTWGVAPEKLETTGGASRPARSSSL